MKTILITGGARSGKSRYAQELAQRAGEPVLFVATAEAGDEEMKRRIEEHKLKRPPGWTTLEATTHIGESIQENIGQNRLVIIDCITLLISNLLARCGSADEPLDAASVEKEVEREVSGLIEYMRQVDAGFIIVTNEVGLGLVPANDLGRLYRDLLGRANQMLAAFADEVYLMVAGLPVPIKQSKRQ